MQKPSRLVSNDPYWFLRNGLRRDYPTLHEDISCEVAVIGGGITAAFAVQALAREGVDVVLLERFDLGRACTAASTALLQFELDTSLSDLSKKLGKESAELAYHTCADAIAAIHKLVAEVPGGDRVQLESKRSLYLAGSADDVDPLRVEFEARHAAGFSVDWLDESALSRMGLSQRLAAIVSKPASVVDPYALTHVLFEDAQKHGARLFDRSGLDHFEATAAGVNIVTENGTQVHARRMVIATGYESQQFLPKGLVDLHSSFAFITKPVASELLRDQVIWETSRPYLYLRATTEGRWIVGGADVPFKNPTARDALIGERTEHLRLKVEKLIPDVQLEPAYSWAATFGETPDGLPYFDELKKYPNTYFLCAFGGNGICFANLGSQELKNWLQGKPSKYGTLFSFDRK